MYSSMMNSVRTQRNIVVHQKTSNDRSKGKCTYIFYEVESSQMVLGLPVNFDISNFFTTKR